MRLYLKDNRVLCNIEYAKGDPRRNDIYLTYATIGAFFNGKYEESLQLNTSGTVIDLYRRVNEMIRRAEELHSEDKPIVIEDEIYEFRAALKPLADDAYNKFKEEEERDEKAWQMWREKERILRLAEKESCLGNCPNCMHNGYEDGYTCEILKKDLGIRNMPGFDYKTGVHYAFRYLPFPDEECPLKNAAQEYREYEKRKKEKQEEERWKI